MKITKSLVTKPPHLQKCPLRDGLGIQASLIMM